MEKEKKQKLEQQRKRQAFEREWQRWEDEGRRQKYQRQIQQSETACQAAEVEQMQQETNKQADQARAGHGFGLNYCGRGWNTMVAVLRPGVIVVGV